MIYNNKYSFVEVPIKNTTVHAVCKNVDENTIITKYFNQPERHFGQNQSKHQSIVRINLISCDNLAISPF